MRIIIMFQGTCHRRKELVLGPAGTRPLRICLREVHRSTTTRIMATDPGPGQSLRSSTKRPGKSEHIYEYFCFIFRKKLLTNVHLTTWQAAVLLLLY